MQNGAGLSLFVPSSFERYHPTLLLGFVLTNVLGAVSIKVPFDSYVTFPILISKALWRWNYF